MDSKRILRIVRKWNAKKPEYRTFRCGNCQKTMRKAWHVWLYDGGFKTEVHFCKRCGKQLGLE